MKNLNKYLIIGLAVTVSLSSCGWLSTDKPKKMANLPFERTMILYSAGFNSLSEYLNDNVNTIVSGTYVPERMGKNAIFVISKSTKGPYSNPTEPCIIRLYKNENGTVVRDTVKKMDKSTVMAEAGTLRKSLEYIKDNYPSASYGMILSSHATGWLPSEYYNDPKKFENGGLRASVKSITQEVGAGGESYEMEIEDFADAIPMHLDYILFDACLAGGVEVAYSLRKVTGMIGFSPAEVLAEGFDYNSIASRLLEENEINVKGVCEDYFNYYDAQSGAYRSATISVVSTEGMDNLAETCRDLFEKYRKGLADIAPDRVQGFFRYNKHWFYDLEDILKNAGASEDDLARLSGAIDKCIVYKAATPYFINFRIDRFCGLSMYLPCDGSEFLDNYYKSLSWNEATGLVQ